MPFVLLRLDAVEGIVPVVDEHVGESIFTAEASFNGQVQSTDDLAVPSRSQRVQIELRTQLLWTSRAEQQVESSLEFAVFQEWPHARHAHPVRVCLARGTIQLPTDADSSGHATRAIRCELDTRAHPLVTASSWPAPSLLALLETSSLRQRRHCSEEEEGAAEGEATGALKAEAGVETSELDSEPAAVSEPRASSTAAEATEAAEATAHAARPNRRRRVAAARPSAQPRPQPAAVRYSAAKPSPRREAQPGRGSGAPAPAAPAPAPAPARPASARAEGQQRWAQPVLAAAALRERASSAARTRDLPLPLPLPGPHAAATAGLLAALAAAPAAFRKSALAAAREAAARDLKFARFPCPDSCGDAPGLLPPDCLVGPICEGPWASPGLAWESPGGAAAGRGQRTAGGAFASYASASSAASAQLGRGAELPRGEAEAPFAFGGSAAVPGACGFGCGAASSHGEGGGAGEAEGRGGEQGQEAFAFGCTSTIVETLPPASIAQHGGSAWPLSSRGGPLAQEEFSAAQALLIEQRAVDSLAALSGLESAPSPSCAFPASVRRAERDEFGDDAWLVTKAAAGGGGEPSGWRVEASGMARCSAASAVAAPSPPPARPYPSALQPSASHNCAHAGRGGGGGGGAIKGGNTREPLQPTTARFAAPLLRAERAPIPAERSQRPSHTREGPGARAPSADPPLQGGGAGTEMAGQYNALDLRIARALKSCDDELGLRALEGGPPSARVAKASPAAPQAARSARPRSGEASTRAPATAGGMRGQSPTMKWAAPSLGLAGLGLVGASIAGQKRDLKLKL